MNKAQKIPIFIELTDIGTRQNMDRDFLKKNCIHHVSNICLKTEVVGKLTT